MTKIIDTERRLVAVFAADVEGYSRLMGADEVWTLQRLTERRAILDKVIADHRGRIANTAGDSVLAEFGSAVDAVQCAVEAQAVLAEANSNQPPEKRINFRIGVHVGDVMVRAGDLFGDSVNIAARLQALAQPGGVCVSGATYDQVRKVLPIAFTDLGAQQFKNIEEPVRAYEANSFSQTAVQSKQAGSGFSKSLVLPDKPSIAVLPFQNMSGDPEQEYFADGMVEEIITALSQFRQLFVIARNSSFTYKGRSIDVKQVGRELGVRYVLEGSVRKAGNRIRITGQLVDATTAGHLWADRFDGGIDDIFDLQDSVTTRVVGAIAPKLELAEIERVWRKPTENLNAYDYFLHGMASFYRLTKEANDEALRLFRKAFELDPEFAVAYGMAAYCYLRRKFNGWMTDQAKEAAEAGRLARLAVDLGKDDAVALIYGGRTLARVVGELDVGAAFINRALVLNPNLAAAWHNSGWTSIRLGEPDIAIEHLATAMRLSPLDPLMHAMQTAMGLAHIYAGRYNEASVWAENALRGNPNYLPALRFAAVSNALGGRIEKAREMLKRLRQLDPNRRISNLTEVEDFAPYIVGVIEEGLRKAGMPE